MFDMRRRSLATAGARAWLVLVVLLMSGAAARAAAAQTMAVPAYFYPGSYWTQLDQAGPGVGVAVMNPDCGPGAGPDPTNPGTQTNQCYEPAADILLTFEGSDKQYVNSYSAPSLVTIIRRHISGM